MFGVVVGPSDDVFDQLFFCFSEMFKLFFQYVVKLFKELLFSFKVAPLS